MCSIYWLHEWNKQYTIDNAKNINLVIPMYNLREYTNNYSRTSGSSWQYYRDEPFLNDNNSIADFPAASNNTASFTFKWYKQCWNNGSIKIFK